MGDKVTGALPTVASGASTDPEYQKEYFEALNQSLKALEGRQTPNLMQIASAFMNPGRSGSFGEALGNAMGVVGKQQEEQEARAPAIAQMRAQLAGQKFQVGQEQNALKAFANVLGVAPDNLQEGMAQAVNNPAMMQRLNSAMPQFYSSPKVFEMAKTMFGQYKDINEANIKQSGLVIDALKAGASGSEAFFKTGQDPTKFLPPNLQSLVTPSQDRPVSPVLPYPVSGATISSGFGERKSPTGEGKEMHPAVDFAAPLGSKVEAIMPGTVYEAGVSPTYGNFVKVKTQDGAVIQYSHLQGFGDEIKPGAQINVGTPIGQVGSTGTSTGPHVDVRAFDAKGNPFNLQPYFARPQQAQPSAAQGQPGFTGESTQKEMLSKKEFERSQIGEAEKARETPAADSLKELATIKEGDLADNKGVFRVATNILNDQKMQDAYGLLFKQPGFGAGIATLARDGVKVGPFGLSVDVYDGLLKQLDPYQQNKLRQLDMALSQIFVQKAQAMKSAFGPQISNADIIKEEKTMASIRDPINVIKGFILRENARNDHRLELSRAYHDYIANTSGTSTRPYKFLSSPEYRKINDNYNTIYGDISNIISNSVQ